MEVYESPPLAETEENQDVRAREVISHVAESFEFSKNGSRIEKASGGAMRRKDKFRKARARSCEKTCSEAALEEIHRQFRHESASSVNRVSPYEKSSKTKKKMAEEEERKKFKKSRWEVPMGDQTERMDTQEQDEEEGSMGNVSGPVAISSRMAYEDKSNNSTLSSKKEIVIYKAGRPSLVDISSEFGRESNAFVKKRFDRNHRGECVVTASLNNEVCTSRQQANFLKIMDVISGSNHAPIRVIKSGFKSVDLFFDSVDKANSVLNDSRLKGKLSCGIITRNASTRGVISDWDGSSLRLAEVLDNKVNIVSIERMLKRRFNNSDKKVVYTQTSNFIITFKGRYLPENVSLYGGLVKIKIRAYVPEVKQCFNCYRFGHTKAVCKSKNKTCVVCSEEFHGQCDRQERCINCGEKHRSNDRKCEKYLLNKQIIKISAERQISIFEAKNVLRDKGKSRPSNVWQKPEEWPCLDNNRHDRIKNKQSWNIDNMEHRRGNGPLNVRNYLEDSYAFLNKVTITKEDEQAVRTLVRAILQKLAPLSKSRGEPIFSKCGIQDRNNNVGYRPSRNDKAELESQSDPDEFY